VGEVVSCKQDIVGWALEAQIGFGVVVDADEEGLQVRVV
jgi:hypothetical protein